MFAPNNKRFHSLHLVTRGSQGRVARIARQWDVSPCGTGAAAAAAGAHHSRVVSAAEAAACSSIIFIMPHDAVLLKYKPAALLLAMHGGAELTAPERW
jgi:hypothetical protein